MKWIEKLNYSMRSMMLRERQLNNLLLEPLIYREFLKCLYPFLIKILKNLNELKLQSKSEDALEIDNWQKDSHLYNNSIFSTKIYHLTMSLQCMQQDLNQIEVLLLLLLKKSKMLRLMRKSFYLLIMQLIERMEEVTGVA